MNRHALAKALELTLIHKQKKVYLRDLKKNDTSCKKDTQAAKKDTVLKSFKSKRIGKPAEHQQIISKASDPIDFKKIQLIKNTIRDTV